MSISVIIPVYNHAHTLERSLRSLARQTLKPSEVILVNDGSTDNLYEVLEHFRDFSITYINQRNSGAAHARNVGFKASTGEFLIFWDADTVAEPHMLEKLHHALHEHKEASYAYCQFKFGWKTMRSRSFDASALKKTNYIDTTSLVRREDFPGFDESLQRFQDWDVWLTMLEKNKTGIFVPEVLFKKIVVGRVGISTWLPRFFYALPWKTPQVKKYDVAKDKVLQKHFKAGP